MVLTGGLASGSFYMPFNKVKNWAWETYWLTGGLFSWIIVPWIVTLLTVNSLFEVLSNASGTTIFYTVLFGILWGIGGLTFGLALRYLGMSLGMALALGLTAAFGTLIPPVYTGEISKMILNISGQLTIGGVVLSLVGIGIVGRAGVLKDRELPEDKKQESIKDFNLNKGLLVAIFAGILSACFAFGIAAGEPLTRLAVKAGTNTLHQNNPTFVLILIGGFATNAFWCIRMAVKNKTYGDYVRSKKTPIVSNYLFSALAGTIWFMQFMFYGMGESYMGKYGFACWSMLMTSTIIFSNIWGLILKEWKGTGRKTHITIISGLIVLILSIFIIGIGSYLQ